MSTIAITDILAPRDGSTSMPVGRLFLLALAITAVGALIAVGLFWMLVPLAVGALGYLGASLVETRYGGPAPARDYHAPADVR